MKFVLYFLAASIVSGVPTPGQPTHDDFLKLQNSLRKYIATDPPGTVPVLVRMSFHDLLDFDPATNQGGPKGCLIEKPVSDFDENKGLNTDVVALQKFVTTEFPNINFTFGDVISLAGKTAVETAYPCLQINWRFGRSSCSNSSAQQAGGAQGTVNTLAKFQPFLTRYSLTAKEMAVLTAGAHGIATAAAAVENSGFGDFDFAEVNSGKDWIVGTLNNSWQATHSAAGLLQYVANASDTTLMRLPSDMVFFPLVIAKIGTGVVDPSACPVQKFMEKFASKDRSHFDNEFAKVYSKMLEIGVVRENLQDFQEPTTTGVCSDNFLPPSGPEDPTPPTPTQTNGASSLNTSGKLIILGMIYLLAV